MATQITTTDEQRQVLDTEEATAVYVVNAQGETTHVALPIDRARHLFDDYLRRELQPGFDQADKGQVVDWDPDAIKAEGRHRLQQDSQR